MLQFKDSAGYVWYVNHIISAIVLMVSFTYACKQQQRQKDKFAHYIVSFGLTILFLFFLGIIHQPWWISPILALSIGIGKEIYDYFHPKSHTCDIKDLLFDFLGVATVTTVYIFSWILYTEM